LKHAAVKVLKAELPWQLLAVAWLPADQALSAREGLRQLMAGFPFASCVPFSNGVPLAEAGRGERTGVLFRAAAHDVPDDTRIARIEALLGLNTSDALRYADRHLGQHRSARVVRHGESSRLEAFVLAGDTRAEVWLKPLLQDELPAAAYGRLLLMPGAKPPVAMAARGRQVCTCFNVSQADIEHTLRSCEGTDPQRLAALQAGLRCGTNCGSCLPELQRLVRATHPEPHTAGTA
ncbi:MAG: (2Fe-2S)-binding protein, partial [Hydrogenophaga sp.]